MLSRRKGLASLVLVAVLVVLITACGSSSSNKSSTSSSGSGTSSSGNQSVSEAKQLVQKAQQPPQFAGPTSKVDISKAKGKRVYYVSLTEEIPALHEWGVVLAQQLSAAGVKTQKCDAKGSPNGITSCLQQALAAHPDAIVAQALDTKFIASYIARAKAAGIKFITAQTGTPGVPTTPGDVAEVTFDYPAVGRMLADWFVADSGCTEGGPQIITTTSSRQPSLAEVAGMQGEIKRLCPSLSVPGVQNVLIPDWPTKLPTLTRSLITSNPNLKYMLPLYDGMTIYMVPAINGIARAAKSMKVASFNATPVVMQNELAKESPLAADVGGPNQWYGVALADQTLRVLSGGQPVADEKVPLRLFTRDNIGTIDVKKDESTWYGSVNPICEYHKLWGLPCS
jgi:ABC-type sugar transport system substrate-binding protein